MTVHLLKNPSDDQQLGRSDPYEELISNARFVPIMDHEEINLDQLSAELLTSFDGLIVTSQRAVDSLRTVLNQLASKDKQTVLKRPVYTVGSTAAERLKLLQFSAVFGEDSGNGVALGHAMVADPRIKPKSRFLFVAGEVHRRQLPDILVGAGHYVDTVVVYRTISNPNIRDALVDNVENNDWIVFFSPSHTLPAREFVRESGKNVKIAAIGPTTEEFLVNDGFVVHATAKKPSAEGLYAALQAAEP